MLTLLLLAGALHAPPAEAAAVRVRHALRLRLDPASHRLSVVDEIALPPGQAVEFLLNAGLELLRSEPALREVPLGDLRPFLGDDPGAGPPPPTRLKRYRAEAAAATLRVEYAGRFDFGLADPKQEYTRGFRETAGIVGPEGVYLAGAGFWYPSFGRDLIEFSLEAATPPGWHLISSGDGTSRGPDGVARWDSRGATDEIHLVGGPLQSYRDSAGAVEALVYLHDKDDALAARYLVATAQYLEMYRALIGPYPYRKFALVENFWETGYGMPSFTLLGPQVIRFPFILTSSYPHEILHNWWGNSVFVDPDGGNWSEGLTSYLADHLMEEQRGKGGEYRQAALQKYRDYVKDGRDFPLSQFRSRHSAATEAVGYGKTMIGFHMLRRELGDDVFKKMLARFYQEYRGRRASFRDLQKLAEAASAKSLGRFFDEWVTRPGAASLAVRLGSVGRDGDAWVVHGSLKQTQAGAPFGLDVPVVVQTAEGVSRQRVRLESAEAPFALRVPRQPLALVVDPDFDVFRKLDPRETPASIGQVFGEPRILAVLPSAAAPVRLSAYRSLAEGWRSDAHAVEVVLDSNLEDVPSGTAAWLYGRENRLARKLFAANPIVSPDAKQMAADGETMPLAGHSFVLTMRHPRNPEKAIGWISVEPDAAFPGIGRKLPHYGKYSYLGFLGDEPVNVLKGQSSASDSPLRLDLRPVAERSADLAPLPPDPRKPLAELPAVFSEKALVEHVALLASPELEGRGLGSQGLASAARSIADLFRRIGLVPGGDGGGYFQTFTVGSGPAGQPVEATNVIGVLPGTRSEWAGQSAVVSAHYDHLGLGWPDVHKGDEGRAHPGADDNASGVAVLLELARAFASGARPPRTLVFIAFSAEEAGLAGSRHYADHPTVPLDRVIGVVNLDTVGRLGDGKVDVLGTGTAAEWQHIFRGASFVTGVESRNIAEPLRSSDQASFVAKGVPAVQLFTRAHADYHRPSDTPDKIDAPGLVKVATLAREVVAYLAERDTPLTHALSETAGATAPPRAPGDPAQGRRVSFGTVPDFSYPGPGVKVGGVVPGSPAEKAGIRDGDVIVAIDGTPLASLQAFSDLLKTLAAGRTLAVSLTRDGAALATSVTVVER